MFTKKDREQYFQKVLFHERAIGHKLQELFQALKDSQSDGSLDDILRHEPKRSSFTTLMYGVLLGVSDEESQAYALIRKFLDQILAAKGRDKRRFIRDPMLGIVRMRDVKTGEEYQAKCIDISPGGIGIENDKAIPLKRSYALKIELYKYTTPTERTGKLVWMREIVPGMFLGGIQFDKE